MGKIWVLDTETKGTGAEMVPLEKVLERKRSAPPAEPFSVLRREPAGGSETPQPIEENAGEPAPRSFKVVNVLTRQVLGEGVDSRELVDLLKPIGSVVDVRIYVWEPEEDDWRPLGPGEKRAVWRFRGS